MTNSTRDVQDRLRALAVFLAGRHNAIMKAWRTAVERDPRMTTGASLPRAQLNDHIPDLLETYGNALRAYGSDPVAPDPDVDTGDGAAHGLQRWQQGYDLREVTREWGLLQLVVADELEAYATDHADAGAAMAVARRLWADLCTEGVGESTAKYFQLQQVEAMGNVRDLEKALKQMDAQERERATLWQEAAHDLRGNLGVVVLATQSLGKHSASDDLRARFIQVLDRNVTSLHKLLEDVTNLARLQAGQEHRVVASFDAAQLLDDLAGRHSALASERNLYLKTDGPTTFVVDGDAIKVQRIAQNLLLNAIKYTLRGGVTLAWGDSGPNDPDRWMLSVQDTGPGYHAGPGAPLAGAIEEATDEARAVDEAAGTVAPSASPARDVDPRPVHQERGEGLGLSIVKRLCELLDATVELETDPKTGTTFRVLFPRAYAATGEAGPDAPGH